MRHLDLFSGIGGFALAADRVFGDVEHVFCEIDPFCQEVLRKHWPDAPIHGDIRTLESGPADLVTGGFPCQPFSQAGKRRGTADDRHLWPEMLRVIRASSPEWVIGENVSGLLTWEGGLVLENVLTDLEGAGYEAWPVVIPACAVGAPHRRDRVWFIAHSNSQRGPQRKNEESRERWHQQAQSHARHGHNDAPDPASIGRGGWGVDGRSVQGRVFLPGEQADGNASRREVEGRLKYADTRRGEDWPTVAARLCRVDDGLPRRLDRNPRLKALGNAIVPQVAEEIMRAIKDAS